MDWILHTWKVCERYYASRINRIIQVFFTGKDCPVDYKRVYDHVRAKMPYKTEEPLDANSVMNATNEMLSSEEYDCLSNEFKQELT